MNFDATRPGALIAVTTGNQNVSLTTLLGVSAAVVASAPDVLFDNRGGADCYVLFGDASTVVTSGTGVRVPAGAMPLFGKGSATHIAVIGAAVTSLMVHLGKGV